MKKKGILLIAVILLSTAPLAQAQEGQLSGTIDVTYLSSYIWRGFEMYPGNDGAIQASIDMDFYGTGLGAKILSSKSPEPGNVNREEMDFTLYYGNSISEGETYATDFKIGWVYYNHPDEPARVRDMQELFAALSWPEICPAGIVPSYTIVCMWPSVSGSGVSTNGGWMHILGLGYDWTVSGLTPETPEQTIHLSVEAVYNDGAAPGAVGAIVVDHDWSHAVLGVSTDFEVADNLTFTPGLHWQISMDNSVNTQDEFWVGVGLSYKF